jgi:2-polyprenyl-6-hydroxyphenyl methylase/3-demethylubiquinone-9 3-methyltransferase
MQVDKFYKAHWTEYPLEIQGVLEHLNDLWPEGVKGKNVLDGGSGSGMVSVGFALLGANVTGVDITPQCVENGKRNAERFGVQCRFFCKDLTDLDLGNERFDIVYSWGVIHHSEDARKSFSNLAKHLKPGGEMVLAVYLKTYLSGFWNFSRVFYQKAPKWFQSIFRESGSCFLNGVDFIKKLIFGKSRYMLRGTNNKELINDWFGVPHRTFHSYDEVFQWFRENGLNYKLVNPATGRFKSTSNFVVRGRKI